MKGLNIEQQKEILRMHTEGMKPKDIAAECGCALSTVYSVLKKERSVSQKRSERNELICSLRNEHLTQKEIAERIGCNRQTVRSVLMKSAGYKKFQRFGKKAAE